jgi:hypothetical protein
MGTACSIYEETEKCMTFFQRLKDRDSLEDLSKDGRILLERILTDQYGILVMHIVPLPSTAVEWRILHADYSIVLP